MFETQKHLTSYETGQRWKRWNKLWIIWSQVLFKQHRKLLKIRSSLQEMKKLSMTCKNTAWQSMIDALWLKLMELRRILNNQFERAKRLKMKRNSILRASLCRYLLQKEEFQGMNLASIWLKSKCQNQLIRVVKHYWLNQKRQKRITKAININLKILHLIFTSQSLNNSKKNILRKQEDFQF